MVTRFYEEKFSPTPIGDNLNRFFLIMPGPIVDACTKKICNFFLCPFVCFSSSALSLRYLCGEKYLLTSTSICLRVRMGGGGLADDD